MKNLKEDELKKLGQNIKRLRKSRGMNQTSLANQARTRPTTISSIENGYSPNPGWDLLNRIAGVLDSSIHDLTQPEVLIEDKEDSPLPSGLSDLMRRQDDLLALGEPRISLQELEWLSKMPMEGEKGEMSAERYLVILRHFRLVVQNQF